MVYEIGSSQIMQLLRRDDLRVDLELFVIAPGQILFERDLLDQS